MTGYILRRLVALLLLAALAPGAAAGEATLLVRCGRFLDVRAGKVLEDQALLVQGNRIARVGPASAVQAPAGARQIDLGEATVLPGLIDAHTHLVDDAELYSVAGPLQVSAAQMAFGSVPHARATLEAGFTSVRDLGTYRALVDVALRDAIDRGVVPGPRMQPCGAYVTITGGAGALTGLSPDVALPLELRFGVADGPDPVRQRVRELIRHKVGVIKVLATGAVLTPGSVPGAQEMSYEEILAAVEEARKAGLKVACHAHGTAGCRDAVRAGVASIEHGSLLDDATMAMMRAQGTFLVADLYNNDWILENPPQGYPAEFLAKMREVGAAQVRVFRRARALGVRIAFGTDAATIPHGTNARQFAVYVAHGMTPLEALRSATLEAADLMGWGDRVGSLEPGYYADLVAVPGDPLADVRVLERPVFVMKDGQVFRNDL